MKLFDKFSKKKSEDSNKSQENENKLNPDDMFFGSFLMNEAKFKHQQKEVRRSSKDPSGLVAPMRRILL